jgi:hypothetical protein
MCVGFHVGWIVAGLIGFSNLIKLDPLAPVDYFLLACLSSGTSYALSQLFGDDGVKFEIKGSSE